MAQAILCIFLELPEEEDGWGGGTRTSCSLCPTLSSPDLEGWGASKNSFSRFSARNWFSCLLPHQLRGVTHSCLEVTNVSWES